MQVRLEKSWQNILSDEFEKSYFLKLVQYVRLQYQNNTCYPIGKNIFKDRFQGQIFDLEKHAKTFVFFIIFSK